jgi:hypothetical protein
MLRDLRQASRDLAARPWLTLVVAGMLPLTVACGPSPLTRDEASDLLSKSLASGGTENLQLATPSGCFALARNANVNSADVERDPHLAGLPYLLSTLRRERELGLVEFEFAEVPSDAAVPPSGCADLWAAQHAATTGGAPGARSKLIAWKTMPSDKAMAAGLQPGETFPYLHKTLIAITQLIPKDDGTVVVEYRWHWAPSYESEHLGVQAAEAITSRARFRHVGNSWRLAR